MKANTKYKFEEYLYEVITQPRQDIPVFKIRSEIGIKKTLHRNHLLPVDTTDTGKETDGGETVVKRPILVKRKSLTRPATKQ